MMQYIDIFNSMLIKLLTKLIVLLNNDDQYCYDGATIGEEIQMSSLLEPEHSSNKDVYSPTNDHGDVRRRFEREYPADG